MKFKDYAEFLLEVENLNSRNEITIIISDFFAKLSKEDIKPALYMFGGRLAPKYTDLEFNISSKLILNSLEVIYDAALIRTMFKQLGDVGSVVEKIVELGLEGELSKVSSIDLFAADSSSIEFIDKELSIPEIYTGLKELALLEGKGSVDAKSNKYLSLISKIDPLTAKYLTRVIIGGLRLGISDKTILDSLSWFIKGDKSLRKLLDKAFGAKADIGELAETVITSDKNDIERILDKIEIKVGIPVASKLVEREKDPEKSWERIPNAFVQPKLDGLRGQIHYDSSKKDSEQVRIFSRNMENMTEQFPEIIEDVKKLGVSSIILDSEIIGFDIEKGEYLTYQETMTRKRKYGIEEAKDSVPVKAMCFDVLYLNGKDVSRDILEERVEILSNIIRSGQKSLATSGDQNNFSIDMLETIQCETVDDLDDYFHEKINKGLEGIIIKKPGTPYDPGTRNFDWIKLKANTRSELVDTLDVVILGYYNGRGQRAKFGIGALLAGVYDAETDSYYSVGKVGSGIKDDDFEKIVADLKKIEVADKPDGVVVEKQLFPDTWVEPKIIMEIDADEITRSPSHTAARGVKSTVKKDDSTRGLSIRFPRMKIWNRDKDYPTTVSELVRMYELRRNK
ncbi:MAG: ATP-dependent DNA ligase [Candidatus Dojkabacteria bacterium]|nr:ATP-dependent DNA ligase [Candidatus Dojkabacteria bacterium]MDQ7021889.1 ATP-dependent DNA ligase [Candidatus Dojkabacteria bacterium]